MRPTILASLMVLTGVLAPSAQVPVELARTMTGAVAKRVCSGVFVAGLEPERLFREEAAGFDQFGGQVEIDREDRTVTARIESAGIGNTAVYREGLGCALANGVSVAELQAQGFAVRAPDTSSEPWPLGDQEPSGSPTAPVDTARLDAALDDAFDEPDPSEPRRTRAVVIVHDGRIVAERYAPGITRDTPLQGWSMAKSVTGALVGVLMTEGRLLPFDGIDVPEWDDPDDPRSEIILDQLLRMSSGLQWDEDYTGPDSDPARMLFWEPDSGAFAAAKPLAETPGSVANYASGTTAIISRAIRGLFSDDAAYWRWPREALFDRIGMRSAVFETDPSGTFVGSSFLWATARDWARFGMLYLNDGRFAGESIFLPRFVEYTRSPAAPPEEERLGVHFALNSGGRFDYVPRDALIASGFDGQFVFIIPSRRAVIVRLGQTPGNGFDADEFVGEVLASLPELVDPESVPPLRRSAALEDTVRALFVGSSYTYVNNLPDLLEGFAHTLEDGPMIDTEMSVRGASTLRWHLDEGSARQRIDAGDFDAVVVQGQSRLGPPYVDGVSIIGDPTMFLNAARELVSSIQATDARAVLFLTWARRDYPAQLDVLADAYGSVASETGAVLSPIGRAWARAHAKEGIPDLYIFDGSHPSPAGSYLTAATLYATLTGRSPEGAPAIIRGRFTSLDGDLDENRYVTLVDLDPATATALQRIAWETYRSAADR